MAAYARIVSAIPAGAAAARAVDAAVIILPLPIPDAIASAYGWRPVYKASDPNNPKKIVPKTVPIIYVPSTPVPSGEFIPYRSPMTPRVGSLQILTEAPIASRLRPRIRARGRAISAESVEMSKWLGAGVSQAVLL